MNFNIYHNTTTMNTTMNNKTEGSTKAPNNQPIFISLGSDFDWNTVVVGEPVKHSFVNAGAKVEWVTSDVWVDSPDGKHLPIYIELAEQLIWGVSGTWPFGMDEEACTNENLNGFQITYPMTSMSTVDGPTAAEEVTMNALDPTWAITADAMERFCTVDKSVRKVPTTTYNAFITARNDDDFTYAIKPVYDYTSTTDKVTGKKTVDESKPMRTYIKFITRGKGANIKCNTDIYGPGNKLVSPLKYGAPSIWGNGHPVVHWDGIFWGSQGQKVSYGASVRLRVSEMNFTPVVESGVGSARRMLPIKTTVPVVEVELETDNEGDDDSDEDTLTLQE